MPVIYKQKKNAELTQDQLALKKTWDAEFEASSSARANAFYGKKHTVGVTAEEQETYNTEDSAAWDAEQQRRIDAGLYKEINVEEQLQQATERLESAVTNVNELRIELGLQPIEVR